MIKAITFDKMKVRRVIEIDDAIDTITHTYTDAEKSWQVTFTLSMYDNKKRPIYTEKSRTLLDAKKVSN